KITDTDGVKSYMDAYENIGYDVELFSVKGDCDLARLTHYFTDKVSVIAGQSGVGKSSMLNALDHTLFLKTDEVSERLGRGKHTTRHVELLDVFGGFVADTPGFSSLDFRDIAVEELASCFPEIDALKNKCRFRGCNHYKEPNCAVKEAVKSGSIMSFRYEHYVRFYEEFKNRKPRY
ncbi:MAG TPA: ribosome small subunit-dependent GTPase A, partial [Bacillota bacterium]|nr:ribosome small subunit-dependent GTPase A [Bacillota bacterium]